MNKKIMYYIVPVIVGLSGCSVAGPPPPPLVGPSPVLDRLFFYLHYFVPFFVFLLIGSLAGGIVYFFLLKKNPFTGIKSKNTPGEIARERYAKGDITREEFLTLMDDIQSTELSGERSGKELENNEKF